MILGREIAKLGLDINAIKLNPEDPFQWASGFRMPIYNDNRIFLSIPKHRNTIVSALYNAVQSINLDYEVIAGTSTAGIPWASFVADRLDLPMIYIRDKPKDHGLRNQIEGIDAEKDLEEKKTILIEDLISTGGSSARAVQAIRDANGDCNYCLSIFDYGLDKAVSAFNSLDKKCNVRSLLTYKTLLEVAEETEYLTEDQIGLLKEWREDPFNWGEKHGFPKVEK